MELQWRYGSWASSTCVNNHRNRCTNTRSCKCIVPGANISAMIVLLILSGGRLTVSANISILNNITEGLDVNVWPGMEKGEPTTVEVQIYFNTFGSMDAAHMDFKIDVFLRQRWNDPRLAHKFPLDHFTINSPAALEKIWRPDTFFENVKEAKIHEVTLPNMFTRIHQDGTILYSVRLHMRLSCHLDLELYPFDSQKCDVRLASYANTDDVIRYKWYAPEPIVAEEGIEIAQFDLISNSTIEHKTTFATGLLTGNFSGLTASFTLRRQNGYHVLQTYIPTILIVSISWVSFWLDPNAIPGRVTLGVTTLLTLTTLSAGVRQTLPPVSYVKAIDVWVGMCMVMVFGALLEFTFVNFIGNKKMINSRLPDLIRVPKFLAGPPEADEETPADKPETPGGIELIHVQPLNRDVDERNGDNHHPGPIAFFPKTTTTGKPQPEKTKPKRQGDGPTYMFYALVIDRICRVLFPLTFLVFNLIYWPFYVYMQRTIDWQLSMQNTFSDL